jgi:hypothetical protein
MVVQRSLSGVLGLNKQKGKTMQVGELKKRIDALYAKHPNATVCIAWGESPDAPLSDLLKAEVVETLDDETELLEAVLVLL